MTNLPEGYTYFEQYGAAFKVENEYLVCIPKHDNSFDEKNKTHVCDIMIDEMGTNFKPLMEQQFGKFKLNNCL